MTQAIVDIAYPIENTPASLILMPADIKTRISADCPALIPSAIRFHRKSFFNPFFFKPLKTVFYF